MLCPPHLCDQWQTELREKFGLPAVIVRPSTIPLLEREKPHQNVSVFEHYPVQVVSIDYAKAQARRPILLQGCADLVIVDEAHTAARPAGANAGQQQRHDLLRALAAKPGRHLLLLTATPHSGVEESFRSLLGLLDAKYGQLDLSQLDEGRRADLARRFIQRRRPDVAKWLGDTRFPRRDSREEAYTLSKDYASLFEDVTGLRRRSWPAARL